MASSLGLVADSLRGLDHAERHSRARLSTSALERLELTTPQQVIELARPWVLFALYVGLAERVHILVAVPVAFATCFAAFVQMHDALHESLGLSKRAHGLVLTMSAELLLKSGHALKATHLRHHGKCLGEDDPEGAPVHWSLSRVLFEGPFHILALRREALRIAPRTKRIQLFETMGTALVLAVAVATYVAWRTPTGLVYWAVAALVSGAMPLWAAYIPHRLAPRAPAVQAAARLAQLWTPVVNSFAYHHVHHANAKVPTALLPELARELCEAGVPVHAHVHEKAD
jgi:beta-carotene hydroxylase